MSDSTTIRGRKRTWFAAAGLLAAGAVAGGVATSALSASAASTAFTASASPASSSSGGPARPSFPGGARPVRPDEKGVSGTKEATLRAAALKAVPGGTVYRIETDAGDGAYEAHMRKADGSLATVKFDENLKVTKVEGGMGAGDPALSRQHPPGAAA
jgi:hypothetical protein